MRELVRKLTRAFRGEMYIPCSGRCERDDSGPCSKVGDWGIIRMAFYAWNCTQTRDQIAMLRNAVMAGDDCEECCISSGTIGLHN